MNNTSMAFHLTTIAGLSTMIGTIIHNIPEDCSCYASQLKYNIGLKSKLPS